MTHLNHFMAVYRAMHSFEFKELQEQPMRISFLTSFDELILNDRHS